MKKIIHWLKKRWSRNTPEINPEQPAPKTNPWLPYIREILEQVLVQRQMDYGRMRLMIIDRDTEPESMLEEDAVMAALLRLSGDLNFLTILTSRPAYFQEYVETMYEENGLLVLIEAKEATKDFTANTVLDFEQMGGLWNLKLPKPSLYLPIYKKSWETAVSV